VKLEDYSAPITDNAEVFNNGPSEVFSLCRDLERKLRKSRSIIAGIADGFELMNKFPRTVQKIRDLLEETK